MSSSDHRLRDAPEPYCCTYSLNRYTARVRWGRRFDEVHVSARWFSRYAAAGCGVAIAPSTKATKLRS